MPLYNPEAGCKICGRAIGADKDDIIGFDFIEIAEHDFQGFGDCLAHVSCLSRWARRDEFIAAWNQALSEYYAGKALYVDSEGRVRYTDADTWRIQHNPAVQLRNQQQWEAHQTDLSNRRNDLQSRMDLARQKVVEMGLASFDNADKVLRDMPPDDFKRHFGELRLSRAFFEATD